LQWHAGSDNGFIGVTYRERARARVITKEEKKKGRKISREEEIARHTSGNNKENRSSEMEI